MEEEKKSFFARDAMTISHCIANEIGSGDLGPDSIWKKTAHENPHELPVKKLK